VGGKAFALAKLLASGFKVPDAACITVEVYREYVKSTGLGERILLELNRKPFEEMRWEEMWDASLRIRNMFLTTPLPAGLRASLVQFLEARFGDRTLVVRSSAPGEDSARASFAGLHESYVNIRGTDAVLEHILKVWASLWSDAALLYRRELGLDVQTSTMAVLVQEIVAGERSGVIFSQNPADETQAVIEAVHGLNQGLVDGTVEPDRWILQRESGRILRHLAPQRDQWVVPAHGGVRTEPLPLEKSGRPPITDQEVGRVYELARHAEHLFATPQDVEWTFRQEELYMLQSRPITTRSGSEEEDKRPWYLSLRRSFENLKALRRKIESQWIPAMIEEAASLASNDLSRLSDRELAQEMEKRKAIFDQWVGIYWSEFIPFAHGARLFGQLYNDVLRPEDPYEFMDLLSGTGMVSVRRNMKIEELAGLLRENAGLRQAVQEKADLSPYGEFAAKVEAFNREFGDQTCGKAHCLKDEEALHRIVLEMAGRPPTAAVPKAKDLQAMEAEFLAHFDGENRIQAAEQLELARTSYRLRDDDNIHLGRIEGQLLAALDEGKRRLQARNRIRTDLSEIEEVIAALVDPAHSPQGLEVDEEKKADFSVKPRQLIGQPAGPGISQGTARVILHGSDLSEFKAGEILVCDALDPNMTFVVPLCAGIVERRGGMLIHGAIIAREYGLPCVTGVPDATSLIHTEDRLTVDGYLGIVVIG